MYRVKHTVTEDYGNIEFDNGNDTYTPDLINYTDRTFNVKANKINLIASTLGLSGDNDKLDFNITTSNPAYKEGRVFYDNTEHTLSYYNNSSDMTLNIGQESVVYVVNKSNTTLTNGQVVYISGAQGNRPKVTLAQADAYSTSFNILGVVTEVTIPNNLMGYITTHGLVNGLNTSSFNEGDVLWLSDTIAGGMTNVEPAYDKFKVRIGYCIVSHSSNGRVLVIPQHSPNKFGDIIGGNYSLFENDGTIVSIGNARTYRDELGDITRLKLVGVRIVYDDAESVLNFTTSTVIGTDYVWSNVQLNHDRDLTATIAPHIHWFQAENNVPNFMLQYRWQKNDGSAKTTSWTDYKCNTKVFNYTSGTISQICHGAAITPPSGTSVSDIVQFRLLRDNANNSGLFTGTDPYTTTVGVLSFDVHIMTDLNGSRTEYTK